MPRNFRKDPQALLDYAWDWSEWLTGGDTIASATVTLPAGLVLEDTVVAAQVVTTWVSGGAAGVGYPATCHIVTAQGREDERTITFTVGER